jgi:RNA recognition motif-containing protein
LLAKRYLKDKPTRAWFQPISSPCSAPIGDQIPRVKDVNILIKEKNMGNKIYVGGLPFSTTEGQLEEIFSAHGAVESARVITDKFTGKSRGFGFVEMGSTGEAQKAIDSVNGTEVEGRTLTVNEAKPQEKRSGFGGDRRGDRGNRW